MARLPQPGSDQGQWGDILNDYLSQAHLADGSLKLGSQDFTISAVTTFTVAPIVPNASFPQSVITGLVSDLSTKNARRISPDALNYTMLNR